MEFENAHRALGPRHWEGESPTDIICGLVSFPLNEEILRKVLLREHLLYIDIQLFSITLRQRMALWPLLNVLRTRHLMYCWHLPFGLVLTHQGQPVVLQSLEDLLIFCDFYYYYTNQLQIPLVLVRNGTRSTSFLEPSALWEKLNVLH